MLSENSVTVSIVPYLLICIIIYYLSFIYRKVRFLKFAWNNNGFFLPILPVVGTTYILILGSVIRGLKFTPITFTEITKSLGYPFNLWLGSYYHYITINPLEVKIVLNHPKCYDKGIIYEDLNIVLKNSIGTAPYEKWKLKRKYFQKSYKPSVLKTFVPTFYEESCKLLTHIKMMDKEHDISKVFCQYAFVNFFLTSAGLDEENCHPDMKQLGDTISKIQDLISTKLSMPFIPLNFWARLFPSGRKCEQLMTQLKVISGKLIELKRVQSSDFKADVDKNKAIPLFDLIISNDSGNMAKKEEFLEDINFFVAAATDTTGNSLSFCFTLLGMHPEIQEILYQEVINLVEYNTISDEDIPKLKYTEAVILETLRLFPTVPIILRRADVDVDLGTKVMPKDTNILIDIFHLQRDEKHWPNPLKYDPTRFLPESAAKIEPYTYMPFSAGPRDCLGKAQAMSVMKITVANVIRKFKITSKYESVDEIALTSAVSIKAGKNLDCKFLPRPEN